MDPTREKDTSIEVRNVSTSNGTKENEVSLAEVENDDGYQYIQINNSETFNNTKGLETENANDGVLFRKLNETETTTTKEMNETLDQESINNINDSENNDENFNKNNDDNLNENNNYNNPKDNFNQNININNNLHDNSDRLADQSERELYDKIIVRSETPHEELTSENYSISVCPCVTTVKFEGETFSYLTITKNDENFFFIKFNTKMKNFHMCDLDEYKQKHLDITRIPYNQLLSFITQMNMGLLGLNREVNSQRRHIRFWSFVKFFAIIVFLAIISYLLYFHGENFFVISANANKNIFYVFCSLSVLFLVYLLYLFSQDLTINYESCKLYLNRQKDLEEVLEKWNREYFGPNLNMNCSIPYTFPYIQITLQPNLHMYLEEHEIYDY